MSESLKGPSVKGEVDNIGLDNLTSMRDALDEVRVGEEGSVRALDDLGSDEIRQSLRAGGLSYKGSIEIPNSLLKSFTQEVYDVQERKAHDARVEQLEAIVDAANSADEKGGLRSALRELDEQGVPGFDFKTIYNMSNPELRMLANAAREELAGLNEGVSPDAGESSGGAKEALTAEHERLSSAEYGDSDVEAKVGGEYGLLNAERSTNRETIKDLGGGEEAPTSSSSFSVERSEGVDSATGGTHGAPSEELEPPLASGAESGSSIEEDSASRSKGKPVSPTAEAAYMPTPEAPTAESPDGEGPEAADGHRLPRRMSGAGQRLTPESPSKPSPLVETEGDLDTPLALPPFETGGGTLDPPSMERIIIPAPETFPKSELPDGRGRGSEAAPETLNLPEGVDVRPQIGTEKIESAGGSWFDRMLPWRRRRKRDNPEAQLESTPKTPSPDSNEEAGRPGNLR